MALIHCATPPDQLRVPAVTKNTPWQIELKRVGLNQKRLAELLGVTENTVSRQMKGDWDVAAYVAAVVAAWDMMDAASRDRWLVRIEELKALDSTEKPKR